MNHGARRNTWLKHGAIALGYALGYVLLRQLSWSHWLLFAGYRLSVLLLVPYRYWPALVVGELGPLAYVSLSCLETFGWVWSSLMLVPSVALAMPVVRFCRDRLSMISAHGPVRLGVVLACTLAVSVVWTLANLVVLFAAKTPASFPPIDYSVVAARYFIGNYLGILTVVPLVLMAWEGRAKRAGLWRLTVEQALRHRLAIESAALVVPALALLVWIALEASSEESRQVARMLMFLPVVGLALRHGWHGAAIGGTTASIAVALTMPALYDTSTLQAEVFVAFAATSMLLFGSRIALLHQQKGQGSESADRSLELARRIQAQCEAQLRQTSAGIELISETIHTTEELMFERLRQVRVAMDPRELRRRTTVTREQLFQLADGLNPVTLREHGLVAALRRGSIARALNTHRIGYWCEARGGVDQLSSPVQLALHRMVSEGISHICSAHSVGDLTIHLRSGRHAGKRWAVVRIDALFSEDPTLRMHGGPLQQRLTASGLGLDAIRDRAALYGGRVKVHATAHGKCISAMVYDGAEVEPGERMVRVDSTTRELLSFS
jgi:two-component system, NarL family, sensor histidine kinase FusK